MKGTSTYNSRPRIWFRFLDDICRKFEGNSVLFQEFTEYINSVHESIKFTAEFSEKSGISRYRKGTEIYNLLFYKLTDGHIYLEFNSCHPTHNKISILPVLCIRRICTEQENFNENS